MAAETAAKAAMEFGPENRRSVREGPGFTGLRSRHPQPAGRVLEVNMIKDVMTHSA
jgi:hypothetical protein